MSVTVGDLVEHPALPGLTVLAGGSGLARPVEDLRWYAGGELGSCTAQLLVCAPEAVSPAYRLEAVVRRAESAAALLVAGPRPLVSTVRIADRLSLPVLSADGDLVSLLHALTVIVRSPELERARVIEDVLRASRARGTGVAALLSALREVLRGPVALLAADGTPLEGDALGPLADGRAGAVPRFDLDAPQRAGDVTLHPVTGAATDATVAWLAARVPARTTAAALAAAEPAVRAALAAQQLGAERDSRFRAHLLGELVAGGLRREVVERAVSAGWQVRGWHTGVHIGLRDASDDVVLRTARIRAALPGPLVERADGWTTWLTAAEQPPPEDGRRVTRLVREALAGLPANWGAYAGIGRAHEGIAGIARTLAEARDAALLARAGTVEHVDELGISRLLVSWRESDLMRPYAEAVLAPVHDPELLRTLQTYLEHGFSVSATAAALQLHRNTVTARIGKLRELLDVDLDNPDHRLALQLACRVAMPR